jgi:hypothetical protein
MSARLEEIERVMRSVMDSLDDENALNKDRFKHLVCCVLGEVPGAAGDEIIAVKNLLLQDLEFDIWIDCQIVEIGKRHGWIEQETVGDLLVCAAAAGDEQAAKLIEMGIVDTPPNSRAGDR